MNATAAVVALAAEPRTETFGQPVTNIHLIAKLRAMPADLLATIRDTGKERP